MKILVCDADDIGLYFRFMFLSICFISFVFYFLYVGFVVFVMTSRSKGLQTSHTGVLISP